MAAADTVTFVVEHKLHPCAALPPSFVRLIWPKWIEGIHWAEGELTAEMPAGAALLAARALHGEEPETGAVDLPGIESRVRTSKVLVGTMAGAALFGAGVLLGAAHAA